MSNRGWRACYLAFGAFATTLKNQYNQLSTSKHVAFWASLASIIGLIIAVPGFWMLFWPTTPPPIPFQNTDFRLRFCVDSFRITPAHLKKAPKIMHIQGKLARLEVEFDLRLFDSIVYGSNRGAPMPRICYESEHFLVYGLSVINRRGIWGESLRFGVPFELQNLAGPETAFDANLFVRDQWYFTGVSEDSDVKIEIHPPH
jgi:hypothetical protein